MDYFAPPKAIETEIYTILPDKFHKTDKKIVPLEKYYTHF